MHLILKYYFHIAKSYLKVSFWVIPVFASLYRIDSSFAQGATAAKDSKIERHKINGLVDFFSKELQSPFTQSTKELESQIEEMRIVIEKEVEKSDAVERDQIEKFNAIAQTGYTPEKFMAEFSEHLDRLPPGFLADIEPGKPMVNLQDWIERSPEVRATFDFVMVARSYVAPFNDSLDPHNVNQIDLSLSMGLMMVHQQVLTYRKLFGNERSMTLTKLEGLYSQLLEKRDIYAMNRHEYGQPKFSFAIAPSNTFLGMLKTISIQIVKEIAPKNVDAARKNDSFWKKLTYMITKIPPFVKSLYYISKLRKHVHSVAQPTVNENKLSASVNGLARNAGKILGYQVEVIGRENLVTTIDSNEHVFLNSNHRDGLRDMIAFAELGIDNVLMFAAVPNFFPNYFKKDFKFFKIDWDLRNYKTKFIHLLNQNFGLIVVGKGPQNLNPVDPTEKTMGAIDRGLGKYILSYPQGGLPGVGGAEVPVQPKYFTHEGAIESIRRRTMKDSAMGEVHRKVRLQPMLFTHNMDPYNLGLNGAEKSKLTVEVFPSIPDRVSALLTVFGGTDAMNMLYRFGAVAKQVTNNELLFGQVRARELEEVLRKHMKSESVDRAGQSCKIIF